MQRDADYAVVVLIFIDRLNTFSCTADCKRAWPGIDDNGAQYSAEYGGALQAVNTIAYMRREGRPCRRFVCTQEQLIIGKSG